jgi:hypothetical protein
LSSKVKGPVGVIVGKEFKTVNLSTRHLKLSDELGVLGFCLNKGEEGGEAEEDQDDRELRRHHFDLEGISAKGREILAKVGSCMTRFSRCWIFMSEVWVK